MGPTEVRTRGASATDIALACDGSREGDVIALCRGFLEVHRQCTELMGDGRDCASPSSCAEFGAFETRRFQIFRRLVRSPPYDQLALEAKFEVLHATVAWLGFEEPLVGEFAMQLAQEYRDYAVSLAHSAYSGPGPA